MQPNPSNEANSLFVHVCVSHASPLGTPSSPPAAIKRETAFPSRPSKGSTNCILDKVLFLLLAIILLAFVGNIALIYIRA